jgi:hypothetical protein
MGLGVIWADAQDDYISVDEITVIIAEIAGLGGTAGRIILGIKIQHDSLPAEIGQAVNFVCFVRKTEFGSGNSG